MKIYSYKNCSTCQKAIKYLEARGRAFQLVDIVQQPPDRAELARMAAYLGGDFKKLFNTTGQLYREFKVADQLKAGMTQEQALDLLSRHGKLIKRPFLLTEDGGTVGFSELRWDALLGT